MLEACAAKYDIQHQQMHIYHRAAAYLVAISWKNGASIVDTQTHIFIISNLQPDGPK